MESQVYAVRKIVALSLLFTVVFITKGKAEEKVNPDQWIKEAETALFQVENYRTIFHKQERVEGKLMEEETVSFKFKKPFKVYMRWIKGPYKGRELLYADGWNNNRMMVHDSGIAGMITVNLDPKGSLAMKGNRHPITDSGLDHLVKLMGDHVRRGIRDGELEFKVVGEETVYGRRTQRIEIVSPRNRAKKYYCYRATLNLDLEKKVPIKVQIYDWDNSLVENYGYEDLRFNGNLVDADFSPKNPEYRF
jgi:outer membrane lipoprotein-sorting protein